MMIDEAVLEKALIDKCIELYHAVITEQNEVSSMDSRYDIDYGVPPEYMNINMYDAVRKTEHYYKRIFVKAWVNYRLNLKKCNLNTIVNWGILYP